MSQPEFLFDFGSPNAYLVHRVLPGIEARTGVQFAYKPVLLGGLFKLANNRSPMEAFGDIPKKMAYEQLETERVAAWTDERPENQAYLEAKRAKMGHIL